MDYLGLLSGVFVQKAKVPRKYVKATKDFGHSKQCAGCVTPQAV